MYNEIVVARKKHLKEKQRQDRVSWSKGGLLTDIYVYTYEEKKTIDKKVRSREVDGKEKLGEKKGMSQRMCAGYSSTLQTCPSGLPGVWMHNMHCLNP